jgi:anthranilate synthase component 2
MLTLIDNYDSFTFNLVQFLGDLGAPCKVVRNDKVSVDEVLADKPSAIIISPGPCDPDKAGICLDLIKQAPESMPMMGVCLGHQCIGQAFGGTIVRAKQIMHGKMSDIEHQQNGLFADVPAPLKVTRYHSLIVDEASIADSPLEITARSGDGTIMALQHKTRPIYGVQFHPESIATQKGHSLLGNFLKLAKLEINEITEDRHLILSK